MLTLIFDFVRASEVKLSSLILLRPLNMKVAVKTTG